MRRLNGICKKVMFVGYGVVLLSASGSCVPDNLWANIWGTTLIDGVVGALRNTVLVAAGLQTP